MARMFIRKDGNKRSTENAVYRIAFPLKLCEFGILFSQKAKIKLPIFRMHYFIFSVFDRAYFFVLSWVFTCKQFLWYFCVYYFMVFRSSMSCSFHILSPLLVNVVPLLQLPWLLSDSLLVTILFYSSICVVFLLYEKMFEGKLNYHF